MNKKHFQQEGKLSSSFYTKIPSENIMAQEALISFCGINCLDCPAYIAKRTDDMELREKTAKAWSSPEFSVKAEEINCDGCITLNKVLFSHCTVCQVRACGLEKGVENCAHCDEYSCEKLERIWNMLQSKESKERLDAIRSRG